jgi:hypothetical protein
MDRRLICQDRDWRHFMLALLFAAALPLLPTPRSAPAADQAAAQPLLPARALSQVFAPAPPGPDSGEKRADTARRPPKSKVVCGMTLVMVDGSADPKFSISPKGAQGAFPIGRMPKPMCGEKDDKKR